MHADFSPWRLRNAPAFDALNEVAHQSIATLLAQSRTGHMSAEEAAARVRELRSLVQAVDGYDGEAIARAIAELQSELDEARRAT